MASIYEQEGTYRFSDGEELDMELNENNFMANMHRSEPLKDRVAIEDPRDEAWWSWYRYDYQESPELFDFMASVAFEVGSVLIRHTAPEALDNLFFNRHQLTDDDFDQLLGGDDEPAE